MFALVYGGRSPIALALCRQLSESGHEVHLISFKSVTVPNIYNYFVENDLLFSDDNRLDERFLAKAPFSKFYREQDNLSPGKIGVWLGWQIVQSYLKHNDVSLQEFLKKDETELFNQSKYKPKK